jgi:predicted nucleic-acid-binding protein
MKIVDANIILRYLLDDHIALSKQAREIIDKNIVDIPIEVLCEVLFVLSSVYKISRGEILKKLQFFFDKTLCVVPHKEVIIKSLDIYINKNLDFVDCILAAYHFVENCKIYTFDKKLERLLGK